jgi:hypothetical protein
VRFFILQERGDDGTWSTRIDWAKSFTQERRNPPAVISVRAVDKYGSVGAPAVLERKETQTRKN